MQNSQERAVDKRRNSIRAFRAFAATGIAVFIAFSLAGCDSIRLDPLAPSETLFRSADADAPGMPPPTELRLNLETLSEASSLLDTRINDEDGLYERRRTWRMAQDSGRHASIVLRRRLNGKEIPIPDDIREAVKLWPDLYEKAVAFEKLYVSQNALGSVHWRRFVAAGQACVLFQQGFGGTPGEPNRLVAGYYCAAAGEGLTPGQAETVVRSVQVIEGTG